MTVGQLVAQLSVLNQNVNITFKYYDNEYTGICGFIVDKPDHIIIDLEY